MDSLRINSLHEQLDLLIKKSSSYREEGKGCMQRNDLAQARHCYNDAIAYLVPKFEYLKNDLLTKGFDFYLSNKMDHLANEIAMIFGNHSLVMLKDKNHHMAILSAQQSVAIFPTAKGFFRLAEAFCTVKCFQDALKCYSESYRFESNIFIYCKYFMLAVDIGNPTVLIQPLNCYTSVIQKLTSSPEFKTIYLEVLLLHKCKTIPNMKTGMAINKCSTACIKDLSKLMMQTTEWELIETLIKHGTIPDVRCIKTAMEQYTEDSALYLMQQVEKIGNHNICYNSFLSSAICKQWNDKFVSHCLKQGAQFTAKHVWTVLEGKNCPEKDKLLKLMVSQSELMNTRNDKGQLLLEFLLEQGMFKGALTLLGFKIDTSGIDIIKIIKILRKFTADKHPIEILSNIIKNKKNFPDVELTAALKYAYENESYAEAAVLIDHGADINSKLVWTVLEWKNCPGKDKLLKLIVSQGKLMNTRNNKGQLPLEFLLEQRRYKCALILLELNLDTSEIDIIKTIKILKKFTADKHPIEILCKIIKNKKSLPDEELTAALKYAYENESNAEAAVLIDHGANISSKLVWTVLEWKNCSGKDKLLKLIVSQGELMNVRNDKGQLPLEFLLKQGRYKCALTLLELNLDTSEINIIKIIKILKKCAADKHPIEILCKIIKNKKNFPDVELTAALKYAYENESYAEAAVLIDHGADINSKLVWTMLEWKNCPGKDKLLKLIVSQGELMNTRNDKEQLPLEFLLEQRRYKCALTLLELNLDTSEINIIKIIKILKKFTADKHPIEILCKIIKNKKNFPDVELTAALKYAYENESYAEAAVLIDHGADINSKLVWTVLQWKNCPEKDKLLKLMVPRGELMNTRNDKKQLPLEFLLEQGKYKGALTLLEFNLDTSEINIIKTIKTLKKFTADKDPIDILCKIIENKKNDPDDLKVELMTALKYAYENERYAEAAVLIDHGADISSCVEESTTVVHVATKIVLHVDGKIYILQKVLNSCKLPINGKLVNKDGQLPHHLAVAVNSSGSETVLKLLFQYNFDLNTKNNLGEMAVDCCRENRKKLKELLEAEMNKQSAVVESTSNNEEDSFQDCSGVFKQDTIVKSSEAKECIKHDITPSKHEIADDDDHDDDDEMSTDELTKLVKKKVDDVLKIGEFKDLENDNKPEAESQETHKSVSSNAVMAGNSGSKETEEEGNKEGGEDWKKFEGCTWEVECTETFWKELAKQEKSLKTIVFRKLLRLADGEFHGKFHKALHSTTDMNLYELKLTKSIRIIWEFAVTYSPRLSLQNSAEFYTEVIRVWSLVVDHDHISTHVKLIEMSNLKGQGSLIKKKLSYCDQTNLVSNPRKKIPRIYQVNSKCVTDKDEEFFPPASAKENEYNVVTFYSISDGFIESILKNEGRRDFPFKGWPKENEIINLKMDKSIILLGRSGTGKTTCCLYRLWNQFRSYWEVANIPKEPRLSLVKPKLNSNTINENNTCFLDEDEEVFDQHLQKPPGENTLSNTCEDKANVLLETLSTESDNDVELGHGNPDDSISYKNTETSLQPQSDRIKCITYDHLQPVFITKNSVLRAMFKKKFYDMAHTAKCLEEHLKYENKQHPCTLQELNPHAYPLFLTSYEWLQLLDASLEDGKPFFHRNSDGSLAVKVLDMDYDYDDYTETLIMLDESASEDEEECYDDMETTKQRSHTAMNNKQWQKVDATYFCETLWRKVAKGICDVKKVNPLLVWIEIKSFIKGSSQALQTPHGYLSYEEYLDLGHKMAPDFADNRETAYNLFKRYETIKRQNGYFDDGDLVFNLFQRLSKLDDVNWYIHQFYIDEVQDFTQAELTLLLHCCRQPNGLFLTGDTAQSIMRGVSFRFSDLRSVFHYISKYVDESNEHRIKIEKPHFCVLTQNFRSHSGILQLAASVIDLLMNFFGSSLDELPRDQGMFPGPKPVLLSSCKFNDLALLLKGKRREASAIEFGARQAIIVQSDEVKKNLRKQMKAIVLTVYESKGLEFDDVLLYNFFSDSKAAEEWRAVINYIDDKHVDDLAKKDEVMDKPRPLRRFNKSEHKALNSELKFLYTAITRARCNLWIYDSDSDKCDPMFYYFQRRDLVTVLSAPGSTLSDHEKGFAKPSTLEHWKQEGDNYMKIKNWSMAVFCYKLAGMDLLVQEAKAYFNMNAKSKNKKDKKYNNLKASLNFLRAFDIHPLKKWINKAATCLFNACQYDLAASLFLKLQRVDLAVKAYVKGDQYETAAKLYLQNNEIEKAIKILLLDREGKSLPYALELALKYNQTLTFEQGCSVNIIAQRTAQYHLQNNNIKHAVACVKYFSEVRDKISLFKKVKLIGEAIQMLYTNKQYDDLYHLLKGQGCFERGAEIAEKLNNNETHCEFLVLLIKEKLSTAQYAEEDRNIDAKMLEKANDRLCDGHETLKLQVELICGILKKDPLACFNVCKKFIAINKFGATEALNAAVNFKNPTNLNLDKIIVIVDCLCFAYDVVNDIEKTGKLSLKHSQLQCRKFYQFEQSESKLFLPPCQFYWMPNLEKFSLAERDSDGMIQFDEVNVYKLLKTHLNNVIHKLMLLDLEKILFSIITSNQYKSLNSVLDKQLDIRKFAKRSYDISNFVICCIKLIEIAHFHDGKSIKCCDIENKDENIKISKWGKLSDYASVRLFYVFSPEWCYYFTFSKDDIRMIKESKITCNLLFTMLRSDQKVKSNINSFLENWRILKLTGCDASTLVKCLKKEEEKYKEKVSKEKSQDKQSNDKRNNTKKTNQSQLNEAMFIQNDSNYSHIFFAWLQSCRCLENTNFMGFAGGVIEQLFILIAERKSLKPKITVLNITYVLEIISIGLFGSLQAALVHMNRRNSSIPLLFPQFYEHLVTSFDPINFTLQAFLDLVAASVVKDKNFKQINEYSLYLLQKVFYLLLGKIKPSFNVLRYASKTNVYKNGFERCLVLCLSLLGNLWSLLHKQYLTEMLSILKSNVSHLPSDIIKDKFPELFTNLQRIQKVKNSNNDVFNVLFSIQQHSQSYMVCLQYHCDTDVKGKFSFNKIYPEQFPTFSFRSSKRTVVQDTKQRRQQHSQQYHEKFNRPVTVAAQQCLTTNPAQKSMKNKTIAVKQRSQKKVPNNSYTLPRMSDVTPSDENVTTNQQTSDVKDTPETPFDENANQQMYMSSVNVASDAPIDENAGNYFSIQPLSHTDSLTEEKIVIATSPGEQTLHSYCSDTTNINLQSAVPTDSLSTCSDETSNSAEAPISSSQTEPVDRNIGHNQATPEKQNYVDKSVDLHSSFQQHNSEAPLFVSSVDSTEAETSEDFHSSLFHASENEEFQSAPLATPVVYTELSESHGVETTETIVPSTPTIDHHTTHATSSNVVKNNDVLFQSDLKPDVEPFESTLKANDEHNFLSNNSGQVQDLSLQAAYQQTMHHQIDHIPNFPVYNPAYAMPVQPIPLTATYHPLTGQLMYVPVIPVIPNPYLPSNTMNPLSYYYSYGYDTSSASSNFQEFKEPQQFSPSGNVDPNNPITNYCLVCGKSIDVEHSEHRCNKKAYTAYQEIKNQYSQLFEDVENVINSTDVHMGIQAQIDKIKERKEKFDRENSQIEENFAWLKGQSLIQCYAKEVDLLLKEYNESLKIIKDALD